MPVRRTEIAVLASLLVAYLGLSLPNLRGQSVTVDEYAHLAAGCAAVARGDLDLYGKNPPLARSLLALPPVLLGAVVPEPRPDSGGAGWDPWRYGDAFVEANAPGGGLGRYPLLLAAARAAGLGLGIVLALLLYAWSRRLHGPAGGLFSVFLLVFSPTFLAHSGLVTTDAGGALASFAAAFLAWRALLRPSPGRWAAAGAGLGAALVSKFTALLLPPLVVVWWAGARLARPPAAAGRRGEARRAAASFLACALSAFAVVHVAYRLQEPVSALGSFPFQSGAGRAIAAWLPAATPVPLPGAMVRGIDAQALDLEQAEMPNYLAGRWSRTGWWYYYPLALLLKTPLALWGMIGLGAALWIAARRRGADSADPAARLAAWIAASTIAALVLASLTTSLDIGVRYLLPAFPFAWLLLGALGRRLAGGGRPLRAAGLALALLYAGATAANHPHHLAFFNRLAGARAGGDRWLLNSNNDWGQDLPRLVDWLEEHEVEEPIHLAYFGHIDPARYGIDYRLAPDRPQPGLHVVSLNLLLGMPYVVNDHGRWVLVGDDLVRPQRRYVWLRQRRPLARIGGSMLVYRVE